MGACAATHQAPVYAGQGADLKSGAQDVTLKCCARGLQWSGGQIGVDAVNIVYLCHPPWRCAASCPQSTALRSERSQV